MEKDKIPGKDRQEWREVGQSEPREGQDSQLHQL